ncbi:MAG TPA: trypsin-like peptidase domain-containing protein [Cytophagaceae bacterium]|nr:trypsin-like peptidase domain-containing protein [Cytophagaceae bacterium]
MMKNSFVSLLAASFLGAVVAMAGYHFFVQQPVFQTVAQRQDYSLSNYVSDSSLSAKVPDGLNFIAAAKAVTPAVVHIKTYYKVAEGTGSNEEIFKYFFGDPNGEGPNLGGQGKEASGSGVIITEDGYIISNNHVVEGAEKIEVTLENQKTYDATLIGTDPTTDLSLLKIDDKNLPFVKYGNSDNVLVGEWVLAVGNPFNLNSTVTAGIISAKARNINILRSKSNFAVESFLQTDAVVNPGNSGGALVNLNGELVGINTAIASPTGSYTGYSFAVPVDLVKKVIDDILKYGEVQRGLLGVSIADMTTVLAKEKGIDYVRGVYVAAVNDGSAAKEIGMKEGDIITSINGKEVYTSSGLQEVVARYRPGDKLKVVYLRKGEKMEGTAVLKNKLGEDKIVKKEEASIKRKLGADLQVVNKEDKKHLGIQGGAQVYRLYEGLLKDSGIKEGFIITSVDKKPVQTPQDLESILSKVVPGNGVLVEGIYPNGKKQFVGLGW